MHNNYKNISVVLADTQFLTNEALKSILSPLFKTFSIVWTTAGLEELLQNHKLGASMSPVLLLCATKA